MKAESLEQQRLSKHPRWPLYKKMRRAVRRHMGHPIVHIEEEDVDTYLAQFIDDLLLTLRELYTADVVKRRGNLPRKFRKWKN